MSWHLCILYRKSRKKARGEVNSYVLETFYLAAFPLYLLYTSKSPSINFLSVVAEAFIVFLDETSTRIWAASKALFLALPCL